MKITIQSKSYSEISQTAPLRWALTYKEGDTYTGQHGWWKCKDFLNDVVIYLQTGKEFGIYGFNNKAKLNEDGGYVALKYVPEFFEHNLAFLNEWLLNRDFTPLQWEASPEDSSIGILLIPTEYWSNTFYISLITSLIRACVYEKCNSFEEALQYESTLEGFSDKAFTLFTKEHEEKCNNLLFLSYQYNNSNHPPSGSTYIYHDAGLQSWTNKGLV